MKLMLNQVVELHIRGGKHIPKVYEKNTVVFIGRKFTVFVNNSGKERVVRNSKIQLFQDHDRQTVKVDRTKVIKNHLDYGGV